MSVPQKLFQPVWLTIIISFIISCSVSACKKAGDKPVVVSQILLPYFNEDTAQGYLEDQSGGNFILATVPANDWCAIEFK